MENHYRTLGVNRGASTEDIRWAYRAIVSAYGPDGFHEAPRDAREAARQYRMRLGEAYEVLTDPHRRHDHDRQLARAEDLESLSSRSVRPPSFSECLLCGSSPVLRVEIRQQISRVTRTRVHVWEQALCRDCGLASVRSATEDALLTGWWGLPACLTNLLHLANNVEVAARLRRLDPPTRKPDVGFSPREHPLPTGRPVPLRRGFWTLALLIALLVPTVGTMLPDGDLQDATGVAAPTSLSREDLVGMCLILTETGWIEQFVPCTAQHDVQIVRVTDSPEQCGSPTRDHISRSLRRELAILCVTEAPVRVRG